MFSLQDIRPYDQKICTVNECRHIVTPLTYRSQGALIGDVQFYCPVRSLVVCRMPRLCSLTSALDVAFVTLVQKQYTKLNNVYLQLDDNRL
jgi:hypothetical protein